jgi:hypothetical protein
MYAFNTAVKELAAKLDISLVNYQHDETVDITMDVLEKAYRTLDVAFATEGTHNQTVMSAGTAIVKAAVRHIEVVYNDYCSVKGL